MDNDLLPTPERIIENIAAISGHAFRDDGERMVVLSILHSPYRVIGDAGQTLPNSHTSNHNSRQSVRYAFPKGLILTLLRDLEAELGPLDKFVRD